jgi:hypothetical protein
MTRHASIAGGGLERGGAHVHTDVGDKPYWRPLSPGTFNISSIVRYALHGPSAPAG